MPAPPFLEEVTVKLHPSVYKLLAGSLVSLLGIAVTMFIWGFDQRQEDLDRARTMYVTRSEHSADIRRIEQVTQSEFKGLREVLTRIEDKIEDISK